MTKDQMKTLRGHYLSLRGLLRVLEQKANEHTTEIATVNILVRAFKALEADFPGMVPKFEYAEAQSHQDYYYASPLRAQVATALGIAEANLAEESDSPVVNQRAFGFITDSDLRSIVERDYVEIQRAFVAQCWKSVIILTGGAIEAVLTDLLNQNAASAKAASAAPSKSDIGRWDFAELIDVAVELKLVTAGVSKLSHPVREFRNLVHASYEVRNSMSFGREEAGIAVEILHMIHRDLSP